MPTTWRIVKKRHAESALDGEGARRFGGRWNSPGTPVVYTSQSRALALLEVLAGLRSVKPIPSYVMIQVSFKESLVKTLEAAKLPEEWRQSPPSPLTQILGDEWAAHQQSAVLQAPSVIVPEEYNFLINPAHPDFKFIRVGSPQEVTFDSRLLP
jgi:RES domain-containing protein